MLTRRSPRPAQWEVLFRVSRLDLDPVVFTDHLVSPSGQFSREATECTLGVNWYLNKWVRTQFNWEHAWFAEPIKIGNEPAALSHEDALLRAIPGHLLVRIVHRRVGEARNYLWDGALRESPKSAV